MGTLSTALSLFAAALPAQSASRGSDPAASREEVTAEAARLEAVAASPAYGLRLRARATRGAETLRTRLERGDFRAGDRIIVKVSGNASFDETLVVDDSLTVFVGSFGAVSLTGVLRAEAAERVRSRVRNTARDAEVLVRPLLRVAVFGPVAQPGYQLAPLDARLDDVLTAAGGPLQTADPMRMRMVRNNSETISNSEVRSAIVNGRTLAELGVRDGDFLVIDAARQPWDRTIVLQVVSLIAGPLLAAALLR